MKNLLIIPVLFIVFIVSKDRAITDVSGKEYSIAFVPEKVYPGDVFIVRSFGNLAHELYFQNIKLQFYKTSQYYQALGFVDIDTKPGIQGINILDGKETKIKYISVMHKEFPVKNITLKSEKVFLSPEDERRADEEERVLESTWNTVTSEPLWKGKFIKPIDSTITSQFGIIRIINKNKRSRHRGTDYKSFTGTPIKSINSGKVVLRDNHFFGGNTLLINHGLGLYSVYLHLSQFKVDIGDAVNKGQVIGLVGNTGRASGPHLHLSVKLYGESINPESLFELDL
jgi:murein DD-endopeptidase MepM/ murein hydrolase activator NlpD